MAKPGSQRNPTIESLKDRIARDPLSRAFLQLAEEYRKEGLFREAIDVCLQGLQRHPSYHTARISLGRTYMEAGDMDRARRAFAEVLDLQPENHLAAKLLAEIQKKTGDVMGAAATFRAILRYYPNDREVATLLQEVLGAGTLPPGNPGPPAPVSAPSVSSTAPLASPVAPKEAGRPTAPEPPRAAAPASPRPPAAQRPVDPPPDFRAEDFVGFAQILAKNPEAIPAAGVSGAGGQPVFDRGDEVGAHDDALQTNTLAELYLRQGLVDRAVEVYRGMLRVDPGNQKAARRLSELASPGGVPAEAPERMPVAATPRFEPRSAAPPGGTLPSRAGAQAQGVPASSVVGLAQARPAESPGRDGPRRRKIDRLEKWLADVTQGASKRMTPR